MDAVIDHDGSVVENVLPLIPQKRINDVVLLDASDPTHAFAYNVLGLKGAIEDRRNRVQEILAQRKIFLANLADVVDPRKAAIVSIHVDGYEINLSGLVPWLVAGGAVGLFVFILNRLKKGRHAKMAR